METSTEKQKILVIAEKPSVARDITTALKNEDKFDKREGYFEGEKYIVSHALGHLLTIAEPHEMDKKFKGWSLKNLPIIPQHFLLKPIEKSNQQLKIISKLLKRKDISQVVNACDAGREGELIFRYIIDYVLGGSDNVIKKGKVITRLWLQSMTQDAIRESFHQLREDQELYCLRDAAMSRSEADWLVGINASRALTSYNSQYGGFVLTPCGRVQTPTLSLLVKREKEIENFSPRDYWVLTGKFNNGSQIYEGRWFDEKYDSKSSEKDAKPDRIFDEKKADAIIAKCQGKLALVEEKSKESLENCQLLHDLTSLQREANSLFGFSAKMTLGILQNLYEKYKLLTYPRTDSRYLPEDYVGNTYEIFKKFSGFGLDQNLSTYYQKALDNNYLIKSPRIYNNKKISDHHAIIPTGEKPKKLDGPFLKVFIMVARRFAAIFYPPAKYLKTTRISRVEGEPFKTEGRVMLELGWKEVYGRSEDDKVIPAWNDKEKTVAISIEKAQSITKPPARYTEASLLNAMESAGKTINNDALKEAMKEKGLGTPATRAAIIEKLVGDRYVVKQDRELVPTAKAFDLFEVLYAMKLNTISSAELTGEWEYKLSEIENGQITRSSFMDEIKGVTIKLVSTIKNYDEKITEREAPFSPINGKKFYEYLSRYVSEDGSIVIRKIMGGRRLKPEEVEKLLKEGRVGPFEDFRSKRGALFPASLVLENGKAKFEFMNQKEETSLDLKDAEEIGYFYLDNSRVYRTLNNYITESYIEDKEKGFKISRILLGKEISKENMEKVIRGEKSDLIIGFRSARTKRLFDAYLEIDSDHKIRFSFPERKTKGKGEKTTPKIKDTPKKTRTENKKTQDKTKAKIVKK